MKRVFALLLSSALLLCFLAGCKSNETPDPAAGGDTGEKVVKIGVFEPSTGKNGAGGKQEVLGMKYANSITPTVDIAGETYKVVLETVDNASSEDKAATAAQQLIDKKVSIVLGSYGSGVSSAASPSFEKAGIPVIGVTCTNPQITQGNKHYFRICFTDPFQGTVQAKFAAEKFKAKKAYTLSQLGNDYDVGLVNYFEKAFKADGGEVVTETFPEGNADFSSYLNSAKASGADVIFAPCSVQYATQIISKAKDLGITIPIMAGDTWDNNKIVEAAQGTDLQVYVSTFYQEGANTKFDQEFKDYINSDPTNKADNGGNDMVSAVSIMGYDAYYVALEAIKAAGSTDPKAINEALWNVKYTGISGDIAFDQVNGDAVRDIAYIKYVDTQNNAWKLEKEQRVD